jgi:hypothetical protein
MIMILFRRHRCIISSSTDSSRSSSNSFAACLPVYLFSLSPRVRGHKEGEERTSEETLRRSSCDSRV